MGIEAKEQEYLLKEVAKAVRDRGFVAYEESGESDCGASFNRLILSADPNNFIAMPFEVNNMISLGLAKKDVESLTELAFECIAVVKKFIDDGLEQLEKRQYEDVRKKISPFFMDNSNIKEYLKKVPNREYLDYTIVYCYMDIDGEVAYTITDKLAEKWGVKEQQLYEDSVNNIKPKGPESLKDKVDELYGGEDKTRADSVLMETAHVPMYVLYSDLMCGASVILLPDFLEEVSQKLNGDYYLMIGTREFVLVVPKNKKWGSFQELSDYNKSVADRFTEHTGGIPANIYYYRSLSRKLMKM